VNGKTFKVRDLIAGARWPAVTRAGQATLDFVWPWYDRPKDWGELECGNMCDVGGDSCGE
jgi:hypothetical protein